MSWQFENFDLEFSRAAEGFTARVLSSPGGEGSQTFAIPINSLELENVVLQVLAARSVRSISSKQGSRLRSVGGALFKAVFAGEILQCYLRSLGSCTEASGLRIRLRFVETPELVNLPWELLYDESIDQWVALKLDTPLVRYLRMPAQIAPLRVSGPLHVLTVVSDPSDVPHLDIESEAAAVAAAFRLLDKSDPGSVVAQTLRRPTPELLQRKLMELPWHVLHFVGHGEFNERTGTGMLVLEDENGKARPITAERFSVMLQGRSLKLVILNSCEGSRGGEDHRSGLAQSLIAQGVPAVIAMQFPITDTAALAFSRMFYHAVVLGASLENAVVEARRAIYQESELEWATPTLYLRSENGLLFERFDSTGRRKLVEPDPQARPVPGPVPPIPIPWWKRRFALPGAVFGVAVIALAISRLAPVGSPQVSPGATEFAAPTVAPTLGTLAPFLSSVSSSAAPTPEATLESSPNATTLVTSTVAPLVASLSSSEAPAVATAAPTPLSEDVVQEAIAGEAGLNRVLYPSSGFGSVCPMPGASVRDEFDSDTHLWDPLPSDVTIGKGFLTIEPPRGNWESVPHDGTLSNGTACATLLGLSASGLPETDHSGAGLVFWKNAEGFWVFFVIRSRDFEVNHYDFKRGRWVQRVLFAHSSQIRLAAWSRSGSDLFDLLLNSNVLTVRFAGSDASFYINGAMVGRASGGPSGPTSSGVFAYTSELESKKVAWQFWNYGVGP